MNQGAQTDFEGVPAAKAERRHFTRHRCALPVEIRTPGVCFPSQGQTLDVSLGGCYISTRFNLSVGAEVELKLWVDGVAVKIKAIVRTSDPGVGDGMQFLQLDATGEQVLNDYFTQLEANPEVEAEPSLRDLLII